MQPQGLESLEFISRKTLYNVLLVEKVAEAIYLPTELPLLWILPADKNLAGAEVELVNTEKENINLKM